MAGLLDTELETFDAHRQELLGRALGKFVLIRGDEVFDVYDSKPDAIASGFKRFGNVPFLVKQVLAVEAPQNFISNHLAI